MPQSKQIYGEVFTSIVHGWTRLVTCLTPYELSDINTGAFAVSTHLVKREEVPEGHNSGVTLNFAWPESLFLRLEACNSGYSLGSQAEILASWHDENGENRGEFFLQTSARPISAIDLTPIGIILHFRDSDEYTAISFDRLLNLAPRAATDQGNGIEL